MRTANLLPVFVCTLAVALVGAGCSKPTPTSPSAQGEFANLSVAEIAKRIVFREGSKFVITQSAVKHGDTYELTKEPKQSQRTVTLTTINGETGSFDWVLEEQSETDGSRQARETAPDAKPAPVYDIRTSEGSLDQLDFTNSHALYLPIRWPEGKAGDKESAVWVSKPVFEELSRTRNSTVYLNVIPALLDVSKNVQGLSGAIEQFRQKENEVTERIDTDFMKAEGDVIEWPLSVNGEQVKVEAIRARSWFGDVVILNNYANPLVLKLDVNPPIENAEGASNGMNLLKALASFEINSVQL